MTDPTNKLGALLTDYYGKTGGFVARPDDEYSQPVRTVRDVLDAIAKHVVFGGGGGGNTNNAPAASIVQYVFTAGPGQTVFTGGDDTGRLLNLSSESFTVFKGNGLLSPTEYVASVGENKITLNTPANSGEQIQVLVIVGTLNTVPTTSAFVTDVFISDGVTLSYPLTSKPNSNNQLYVFENAFYQKPSSYSLDTSSVPYRIVFPQPFAAGSEIIINAFLVNAPGSVSSTQVEYNNGAGNVALSAALDAIFNSLPDGVFKTVEGNVGSTVASNPADVLGIKGVGGISTTVIGDDVFISTVEGALTQGASSTMPPTSFYDMFEDFGLNPQIGPNSTGYAATEVRRIGAGNNPAAAYISPLSHGVNFQFGGPLFSVAEKRGIMSTFYSGGTSPTAPMYTALVGSADSTIRDGAVSAAGPARAVSRRYLAVSLATSMPTGCTAELTFCAGRNTPPISVMQNIAGGQFIQALTAGSASAFSFYFTQGTHTFWQCRITNGTTITDVATTVPVPAKSFGTFYMAELYYNPTTQVLAFKIGNSTWSYGSFGTLTALDGLATGWGVAFGKQSGVTASTTLNGTEGMIVDWVRVFVSDVGQVPVQASFAL